MFLRSLEVSRLHAGRLAVLALGVVALACTPVRADGFSAGQKAEIESIIKDYLMQKPEVLREAIGVLEAREKAAETKARQDIVADPSGLLFSGANQAVIGNPGGKITLIEFFDYNCGYCKRALNDLARLMKDNPDLRVVLRDLPILSPGSVEAARVANAARLQFKGDKFWEFHQKLLGSHGPVGKAEALAAAKETRGRYEAVGEGRRCASHRCRHRGVGKTRQIPAGHGHTLLCDRRRCCRRRRGI